MKRFSVLKKILITAFSLCAVLLIALAVHAHHDYKENYLSKVDMKALEAYFDPADAGKLTLGEYRAKYFKIIRYIPNEGLRKIVPGIQSRMQAEMITATVILNHHPMILSAEINEQTLGFREMGYPIKRFTLWRPGTFSDDINSSEKPDPDNPAMQTR